MNEPTNEQIRQAARDQYSAPTSDNITIDDAAPIITPPSEAGEGRRWWVQAWVYVREEDLPQQ